MKIAILSIILLISTISFSQKLKDTEGDIKDLKGVVFFDVIFDYTNVEIPHYESEEVFLEYKTFQKEKQVKGSGLEFKEKWFSRRKEFYEPAFTKSFNNWFNKTKPAISSNNEAEFEIRIEINFIYTGYNVVAANEKAKIGAIISIYNKNKPTKVVFKGRFEKIRGYDASYDETKRIATAFANLAKHTALYILRKAK